MACFAQFTQGVKHRAPLALLERNIARRVNSALTPRGERIVPWHCGDLFRLFHPGALRRRSPLQRQFVLSATLPSPASRHRANDIRLIPEVCQTVPASVFAGVSSGDFLFVDSRNAVKLGSMSSAPISTSFVTWRPAYSFISTPAWLRGVTLPFRKTP
jgi:hypothetical protein